MTNTASENKPAFPAAILAWVAVAAAAAWAFWPTFRALSDKWLHDAGYSHGILVPFFAGYLLWLRREHLRVDPPMIIPGLAMLALSAVLYLVGGLFIFDWFDAIMLLPALLGITMLLGGRSMLRASWPAILFLVFMIPLPYRVNLFLGGPLQTLASRSSTFLLQVLGQPAVREGNVIMLNDIKLNVVDACSGLRMLVTFFTFSTGVAILIRKPMLERLCIVLSAVPIALVTNIGRITATGVMYQMNAEFAHRFFHDLAGWFMMPICLALLGIELWMLNRLIIEARQPKTAMLLR
jgi:exosortase